MECIGRSAGAGYVELRVSSPSARKDLGTDEKGEPQRTQGYRAVDGTPD